MRYDQRIRIWIRYNVHFERSKFFFSLSQSIRLQTTFKRTALVLICWGTRQISSCTTASLYLDYWTKMRFSIYLFFPRRPATAFIIRFVERDAIFSHALKSCKSFFVFSARVPCRKITRGFYENNRKIGDYLWADHHRPMMIKRVWYERKRTGRGGKPIITPVWQQLRSSVRTNRKE